jgi:hypothetical protein
MTNSDLTHGYMYTLDVTALQLRELAARIERIGKPLTGPDGRPRHSDAAAHVMSEILGTVGNLRAFNLIQNAAHADAHWNTDEIRYSVTLTEVGRQTIRTIQIVRDAQQQHVPGGGDLVQAKGLVDTLRGKLREGYEPVPPLIASGLSAVQAQRIVDDLADIGSTAEITEEAK